MFEKDFNLKRMVLLIEELSAQRARAQIANPDDRETLQRLTITIFFLKKAIEAFAMGQPGRELADDQAEQGV